MLLKDKDVLIFMGDSVTDADRVKPDGEGLFNAYGFGYVNMINNFLHVYEPDKNIRVINKGLSGNTSRDLLARFDTDCTSYNPDVVSIQIGINDVWRQFDAPHMPHKHVLIEEYEANLEAMILKVKDNVRHLIIMSPYYLELNNEDLMKAKTLKYIEVAKKLANKYNAIFVNLQEEMEKFLVYKNTNVITWDRVHPGNIGSLIIAKSFLNAIGFDHKV